MKAVDTLIIIDDAFDRLAKDLAEGHSEQLTRYLAFSGRFHNYSVANIMLIWSQRPDATRVAGFQAWKKLGRQVRRGEKGIAIVAPMRRSNRRTTSTHATPEQERDERVGFRVAHVFDVAQTDGDPLPEFASAQGDPGPLLDNLRGFASERGIAIDIDPDLGTALGVSRGGRISLRPGLTPAEEFSTLAHELAHELLHQSGGARTPRSVRELEAEAVAFAVTTAAGLDNGTASRDYIHLYQGDRNVLIQSLGRIRGVANEIASAVLREKPQLETAA